MRAPARRFTGRGIMVARDEQLHPALSRNLGVNPHFAPRIVSIAKPAAIEIGDTVLDGAHYFFQKSSRATQRDISNKLFPSGIVP